VTHSKLIGVRAAIAMLSVAGLLYAGATVAQQQKQPAANPTRPEDRPLPRKPDLPDLGEPPIDSGSGAAPIRNDVRPDPRRVAQADTTAARPAAANEPAAGAAAQANPNDITLAQARRVVEAAVKKATELSTKMDIAVVDAGSNLKGFARMDGAWLGSIDISIKKAKTARYFDMNTGEIGKLSQPGGPLYNIEHSNGGLITFPGGVPIRNANGVIIGAVGVSGSTVENDHEVAKAAAEAANAAREQ
jgi:uncharacterized protein GlcG (DUF336 family)